MKSKTNTFLGISFLSSFGDSLLVIALPIGIGVETGDIRIALIAWLVPSLAMFISSFFGKIVKQRKHTERKDYALLLLAISCIEIFFGGLVFVLTEKWSMIILIAGFVFLYAITKEGITRLIYNVSIYKFFCDDENYTKVSGRKAGLDIVAGILGVLMASYLISTGDWRFALIIDALTFLLLSLCLLYVGHDVKNKEAIIGEVENTKKVTSSVKIQIFWVALGMPLLHAVNASYAYFQSLIVERADIMTAAQSVLIMTLLRLPSLIGGFYFERIIKVMSLVRIVSFFPCAYLLASIIFIMYPSMYTMLTTMFLGGISIGLYNPACVNILNSIERHQAVEANIIILRAIGLFQGIACLISMYLYSGEILPTYEVVIVIGMFTILSIIPAKMVVAKFVSKDEQNIASKVEMA
ncbi:hypothetical protein PE36_03099 [Moritella sp. PE36]|uniref:MFS transporter n=1 Tax=Moritella sp. PE36 TaxID=58051 RepID=UPI0001569895|nr:MFS transporter [Moritella sp. PE36]EDM66666.1 hypothetical protein PE36_03099 [Moritella sp. PE36]